MAAMDEFREEREAMKHAPLKKRLEYFWDYNKLWVLIGLAVVLFVAGYIYTVVTDTETVLSGLLINTYTTNKDLTVDFEKEFCDEYGIDTSKYDIQLNTTLTYSVDGKAGISTSNSDTRQVILAKAGSGQLDFVMSDLKTMTDLAYGYLFEDLREILTEEQLEEYEPYFLYVDRTILDIIEAANNNNEDIDEIVIPSCSEPEKMDDPIPVFINLSECEKLNEIYEYDVDHLVIAVSGGAPHVENVMNFVEYLMR